MDEDPSTSYLSTATDKCQIGINFGNSAVEIEIIKYFPLKPFSSYEFVKFEGSFDGNTYQTIFFIKNASTFL